MQMVKRILPALLMIVVLALLCPGCTKPQSSLEGRVLNKSYWPVEGAVVTAKQLQPVFGYWEFTTTTNSEGEFVFDQLHPDSDYSITLEAEGFQATGETTIHTSGNKETFKMPKPIILGFLLRDDGAILDIKTGLVWAPNPGFLLDWRQAEDYTSKENLLGESDWRLPTKKEASRLFDRDIRNKQQQTGLINHIDPIFGITHCYIWTSHLKERPPKPAANVWLWDFGKEDLEGRWASITGEVAHVLSVRSIRKTEEKTDEQGDSKAIK